MFAAELVVEVDPVDALVLLDEAVLLEVEGDVVVEDVDDETLVTMVGIL
jgi:hypothetical protein